MANFLLQNDALEMEEFIITQLLDDNKYTHSYKKIQLSQLEDIKIDKNIVPIGTIEFITNVLRQIDSNFNIEVPIEIPTYLQTEEFLKRDYSIVTWDQIPRSGKYFLKDVSELKRLTVCTDMQFFINEDMFDYVPKSDFDFTLILPKSHLYQISSVFNFDSEYRVYIIDGKIDQISLYNGDATVLPDVKLIQKAVNLINFHEKWLKSYSLDVMVGKTGTAIVEVHNFASLGLYSTLWGNNLLYAYKDGIDYLLNDNSVKYLK